MSSQNSAEKDVESTWGTLDESVKRTVIAMRDYAQQKETDFQTVVSLCSSDLGVFLKDFYLTLKDNNECDGSTSSHLQRVRSELAEYFKKVSNVDIINGADFAEGNALIDGPSTPRDIDTKLPVMKKHNRQRTFTFETNELRQIYMSDAMNLDQPETLQNKVFFDVCMYICNRGKDFLRLMTKSDLEISSDENGRRYVWLKYDTKFSFNEVAGGMTCEGTPGQQIGDRMYARPGDPKCPVLSYTKYAIHLHPMSDAFWQRPKRSVMPTDFVWFDNVCIGNSTLNKLMNRITQSAGLPDSYAINAIKPSYIPIIESICRSALFGSQQFRRILQMKHANHDSHQVRKRHSEGSLTIANTLQESPMFRPRHSESQLPVYKTPSTDGELMRSNSASPILRGGAWETGPPAMFMKAMKAMPDHRRNSPDGSSYHKGYRNSEPDFARYTYGLGYRNGEHESPQEQRGGEPSQSGGGNGYHYGDDDKKKIETGSILQAKHKCLDIVHSLEVRDIKSFINWMKTFEVKHGPGGLMVTCQPVNAAEMECQSNRVSEQNGIGPYLDSPKKEAGNYSKYEGCQWRRDSLTNARDKQEFLPLRPEFENVKGTYCSATELSPLKITVPMQDTLLLTGLKANAQVLIHDAKEEGKYAPLQTRIFRSSHQYDLDHIETVALREASAHGSKYETGDQYDSSRSNCYKEEKSIPVKKRLVVDQSDHSVPQSSTQSMSPPNMYPHPHSPPNFNKYSSQQRYAVQAPLIFSHSSAPTPSVPKYRERFPDGWGYIPLQKRQKFGIQMRPEKDDVPLDLIKQN